MGCYRQNDWENLGSACHGSSQAPEEAVADKPDASWVRRGMCLTGRPLTQIRSREGPRAFLSLIAGKLCQPIKLSRVAQSGNFRGGTCIRNAASVDLRRREAFRDLELQAGSRKERKEAKVLARKTKSQSRGPLLHDIVSVAFLREAAGGKLRNLAPAIAQPATWGRCPVSVCLDPNGQMR